MDDLGDAADGYHCVADDMGAMCLLTSIYPRKDKRGVGIDVKPTVPAPSFSPRCYPGARGVLTRACMVSACRVKYIYTVNI